MVAHPLLARQRDQGPDPRPPPAQPVGPCLGLQEHGRARAHPGRGGEGRHLAAAAIDGRIRVWSTSSSSLYRLNSQHKGRVRGLATKVINLYLELENEARAKALGEWRQEREKAKALDVVNRAARVYEDHNQPTKRGEMRKSDPFAFLDMALPGKIPFWGKGKKKGAAAPSPAPKAISKGIARGHIAGMGAALGLGAAAGVAQRDVEVVHLHECARDRRAGGRGDGTCVAAGAERAVLAGDAHERRAQPLQRSGDVPAFG